jgi:soluble lytic murein transglycosylase-like protein
LNKEIFDKIKSAAESQGIDPDLFLAIVMKESAGNPWMMRYEPMWKYTVDIPKWAQLLYITPATEKIAQSTSWGLGQVMGSVAREYGFEGLLSKLCDPDLGLKYSTMHFKKFLMRYGDVPSAVSAYNQGSPARSENGLFKNQPYVDWVLLKYASYRRIN